MPAQDTVKAEATAFSPTELAALRERREAIRGQWVSAVRAEMKAPEGEGDTGVMVEVSPETIEATHRFQAELDSVNAAIKMAETAEGQRDLTKREEDLTAQAPNYRDLQAKRDAKFFEDFLAVGHGKYENPRPNAKALVGPDALSFGMPLIATDPVTGRNEVYPVNAVFTPDEDGKQKTASVEASMRQMAIISEDKFGQYDPVTGNRLGHNSPVGRELVRADVGYDSGATSISEQVADTYLSQGGMLYKYELQVNELAQYFDIKQTPYVNDLLIDRRTEVKSGSNGAGYVDEAEDIAIFDSQFDTITIQPSKIGRISGMSHEASMTMEPWSVAETIVSDAGFAIGQFVGQEVVTGTGQGDRLRRRLRGLTASGSGQYNQTANRVDLGSAGQWRSQGVETNGNLRPGIGVDDMVRIVTSIPKEYFKMGDKKLVVPLEDWARIMGSIDADGRKLFNSWDTVGGQSNISQLRLPDYQLDVILDQNLDRGTPAVNQNRLIFGLLKSVCLVYYGPPRVDYSMEYGYRSDRYYWRFIVYRGQRVIDPNGLKIGRLTAA